jgi:predicted nucleic acid-binding protein
VIAVDTNILVDLFLPTDHSSLAREVAARDNQWHAPLLWRSEFASVLWQYHRLRKLPHEAARAIFQSACEWMEGGEHIPDMAEVMQLAFDSDVSTYDCEFVATAKAVGAPLLSRDRKLIQAFTGIGLTPAQFVRS